MSNVVKYGLIAAAIGGVYLYGQFGDKSSAADIDLNVVLDVTSDTIYSYQERLGDTSKLDEDEAFAGLAKALEEGYNSAVPALHPEAIGVNARQDASLLAYQDTNANRSMDDGEPALFLIEIDGDQQRIIATGGNGEVKDHSFSGTSLLAGYMIGSMLGRQRAAGVSSQSLANKKPVSARTAAKARAGSGSHSRGK